MVPFDRLYTLVTIISTAISCIVFELFGVE